MATKTEVRERPILFSGEMVRAILDGRKTMTRRVVKPQPSSIHSNEPYWHIGGYRAWEYRGVTDVLRMGTGNPIHCPYGDPADRLWVREAHHIDDDGHVTYRAQPTGWVEEPGKLWRPSIHMPRSAPRITLEITDVRVEQVQEITEADAAAEGVRDPRCFMEPVPVYYGGDFSDAKTHRDMFAHLWDRINSGCGFGWSANPWVWVVSFRVLTPTPEAPYD